MRMLVKTTMSLAALVLTITASALFAIPAAASGQHIVMKSEQRVIVQNNNGNHDTSTQQHVNSLTVTQSGGNKPEVECEGDWKCEIMGNTVVATSNDNSTTAATTTTMSQSNVQLNNGGDGDEDVSTINQDNFATGLVSTIIGRLFHNPMLHWWWLGG